MSRKSLLMAAAAVLSLAAVSSANGAIADNRFESAPIMRELGSDVAPIVRGVNVDESVAHDFTVRGGDDSHIVQAGFWSSVKKATKAVGGTVKNIGTGVKNAVTRGVKKVVTAVGRRVVNAPGIRHAKKIAQKVGTKIGKKIAKAL